MRLKNDGARTRTMLDENIGSNNELNNEKTLSIIKGDYRTQRISRKILLVISNNFPVTSWVAMKGLMMYLG